MRPQASNNCSHRHRTVLPYVLPVRAAVISHHLAVEHQKFMMGPRDMAIRRKDLLQDTARDSGDDSPLTRRSSRRLGSLHSADQPRLGSSTPAMAVAQPQRGSASPLAEGAPSGERVMLYFGIIDFLQVGCGTMRFETTTKVLAKCLLVYWRIS